MKLSETRNISEILKKLGIYDDLSNMTPDDMEKLARNPEVRFAVFDAFGGTTRNVYQELEMDSPYINTHRDISYVPENLQLHSHSFYEILYCESGSIQYLIADKRYRIHSGDIVLVPPGVSHRPIFYEEMTEPYSRIVLWISVDFLRILSDYCAEDIIRRIRAQEHFLLRTEGTQYKYLETLFQRGILEVTEMPPLWEMSLFSNTTTLLVHLCRAMLYTNSVIPIEKQEEIDKIITYIENNYAEKITLEETAKKFHISTSTLGKLFYNKLGISFYHFVTQRRLINCKQKIEEGNSMEEVALSCGFCDYSAFYRAFKKEYGISPREYKNLTYNSQPET